MSVTDLKEWRDNNEFAIVVCYLSNVERRLIDALWKNEGKNTRTLQNDFGIGNVSQAAKNLNRKLENFGDSREVVCRRVNVKNSFGETSRLGFWTLQGRSKQ